MEAAGALGRGSFSTYLEATKELVRSRSRTFWIVAGLTVLAAAVRFATLGLQSYHHDEIVTASRILRGSFWHAMDAVGFGESANDEMCFFWAYYYPSVGPKVCAHTDQLGGLNACCPGDALCEYLDQI